MRADFVWADLSTFDSEIAKSFYSEVFGWYYTDADQGYFLASLNGKSVSGLYTMPSKFKNMNLPSFWMSYIKVEGIEKVVEQARARGGILELVDLDNLFGKIALIRDPSGAGFTVYEGDALNARTSDAVGSSVWNALFVSDASLVMDFYRMLFNWKIEKRSSGYFDIYNEEGTLIAAIHEIDNVIKGKHEYWAVYFAVSDREQVKHSVLKKNGTVIYEDGRELLLADPFGAMFQVVEVGQSKSNTGKNTHWKWRAYLGLILILLSIVFNWYWAWGLFFLIWIIPDIVYGQTHLLEPVNKSDNPILFWTIMSAWMALTIYSLLYYLGVIAL